MYTMITLLNPFSIRQLRAPFMDIAAEPIHKDGDFKIYKYCPNWFVHTFKNIVIAERSAANKTIIANLINDIKPTDETDLYFEYERPKQAMLDGIEAAKKLNFKIV